MRNSIATGGLVALLAGGTVGLGGYLLSGPNRVAHAQALRNCDTPTTEFCNAVVGPPPGWQGVVFKLSQNYPAAAPTDAQPWTAFDPTTQPDQYIAAVLAYFYEGNIRPDLETSFDPALNTTRAWYHAPWQDVGTNGREPIHGLTRERTSDPFELDPKQQKSQWNNYAVGFYNAPGGVTIGKVWTDHGNPDPTQGVFPEGTVAAKLLFTTATEAEVPYLAGSPTWNAYIYAAVNNPSPRPTDPRAIVPVRLLQIDIAVKDKRGPTGWVFGTFVYGGGPGGPAGAGWTNVAPVGLMWGNDPGYSGSGPLKESWINPAVHMPHLGYQGRLNGPVDNKVSACMSCHMTAEDPSGAMIPSTTNPARWFQNIPSGQPFDAGRTSLDYSLQLAFGIKNFEMAQQVAAQPTSAARRRLSAAVAEAGAKSPRDGGPVH